MIRKLPTLAAFALAATPVLAADTYNIDKGHSEALFQVRHLVGKVSGRFREFSGTIHTDAAKPELSSVEFTIKTASIDTANDARDKDLRSPNFFDVEKLPEITFKSSKIVATGKDHYNVSGPLTIHGVAKEVVLPVTFLGFAKDPWGNERAGFETSTTLNRKDYGIVWNKVLDNGGTLLGDDVNVSINLETVKQKEGAPAAK
ncbi:MAG TPA: YceI family protein [Vicinamibacteria bacterium]|jgi:polyisoprenoid-binding protein YceI|nr:YceI family protein [Vicinamibacteria bacterium]